MAQSASPPAGISQLVGRPAKLANPLSKTARAARNSPQHSKDKSANFRVENGPLPPLGSIVAGGSLSASPPASALWQFAASIPLPSDAGPARSRRSNEFCNFAAVVRCVKNAKFLTDFRAVSHQKRRETLSQTPTPPAPQERILQHVNGAPRRRTQKQNSTRTLAATRCSALHADSPYDALAYRCGAVARGIVASSVANLPSLRRQRNSNPSNNLRVVSPKMHQATQSVTRQNGSPRRRSNPLPGQPLRFLSPKTREATSTGTRRPLARVRCPRWV